MTNYSVQNVDEYIAAAPDVARPHLREIRSAVKSALPKADETISYGKPYYKYPKHTVGFDVYTHHIGFEIFYGQIPNEIRTPLEEMGYKVGNKSFQIRYDQSVPVTAIKKLAKAQAELHESKAGGE